MAYDKIITLHGRMDHCINYVMNEEKTSLANVLEYTQNPAKTQRLVTGINCDPETALYEMKATKRRWDKDGGIIGYHIIHSYAPGEVTPEEAHAAGVEFAKRLLGDRYETVVSTHIDREHLHCHIVFNSVSFVDGKKYRSDFKSYFEKLRGISNDVSREHGLSVIEPEGHGKGYVEWSAEKKGRAYVRQDVDAAIAESFTFESFLAALRRHGYQIKYGSNIKHTAVLPPGGEKFYRLDSLGNGYTEADIRERLAAARNGEPYQPPQTPLTVPHLPTPPKRYKFQSGTIHRKPRQKPHGFRTLYIRYFYLLGGRHRRTMPSSAARREITKLQRYQRQFRFLLKYRIDTDSQLTLLGEALQGQIDLLTDYRKELYGQRREGRDVDADMEDINQKLRSTRRELKTCRRIAADIPHIREREQLLREQDRSGKKNTQERTVEKTKKEEKSKWM